MHEWQQRVIAERDALSEKIDKLESFVTTKTFHALPYDDQELLQEQRSYMRAYCAVLNSRMLRFKP